MSLLGFGLLAALIVGAVMLTGRLRAAVDTSTLPPPTVCPQCTQINAADFPQLRPGYWQINDIDVQNSSGGAALTGPRCLTADNLNPQRMYREAGCSIQAMQRTSAGAYEFDEFCNTGDGQRDDHYSYTGDFNTTYTLNQSETVKLTNRAPFVSKLRDEAHYLGDCPAGR
jgi:hypothetical protein